jgi:uncharacterized FlaG/YvyC family protein
MSFDGIPRPSQINPHNPLGAYAAHNAARTDQAGKPLVKSPNKDEQVKALQQDHYRQQEKDDDERGEPFSEDEIEALMLLAKMRGVMNFALDPDVHYEFRLDPESGQIELREIATNKLMLRLTPDEMMQLAEKIHRAAGMLTDQSG